MFSSSTNIYFAIVSGYHTDQYTMYSMTPKLHPVREDDKRVVYTACLSRVPPRDFSASLLREYGERNVEVFLRRGIYIVYVDRDADRLCRQGKISPGSSFDSRKRNLCGINDIIPGALERCDDVERAGEVLSDWYLGERDKGSRIFDTAAYQ